ncbi:DoxX-like family protein [Lentibacillus saliphilus]|uniref:DoxX-like family protein n=1 Tax=Lentibacillus saliphilus TaxID=2737028 RepID=UPI001C2F4B9E|nr:DoxX-like family protein [Lentibacillus saliphilus]
MRQQPIYVETSIKGNMDALWDKTQTPELHEQWDLRFSSITYLDNADGVQHFTYERRLAPGIYIKGWRKTVGYHNSDEGTRTSSLHFGTDQITSPIKEGRGYWQYTPNEDSITVVTQYDYEPGYGRIGKWADQLVFRPLMGFATALSFDVLKGWVERGEAPALQYRRLFTHWLLVGLFFFVWAYHGLVPKLLFMHPLEISMIPNVLSMTTEQLELLVIGVGVFEILVGMLWLFYPHKRHLYIFQIILFTGLLGGAVVADPSILTYPFNPLNYNIVLVVVSIIGYMNLSNLPSAGNCLRERKD